MAFIHQPFGTYLDAAYKLLVDILASTLVSAAVLPYLNIHLILQLYGYNQKSQTTRTYD